MDNIRPIKTEEDYEWALAEIAPYFDDVPKTGTPDAARFDVLADLISVYEDRHHAIEALNPIEYIKAYMLERGYDREHFIAVVGTPSRASEFLNKKRTLSKSAVYAIHKKWGLSASVLIKPYHLAESDDEPQASSG
jgi:HTH-type transcriptional regulator/antitoxin HigA